MLELAFERFLTLGTPWLLGALTLVILLVRVAARHEGKRLRALLYLTVLHLILFPVAVGLEWSGRAGGAHGVQLAIALTNVFAYVGMAGVILFSIFLPRARLNAPRIVQDVVMAAAGIVGALVVVSRYGINLSGIIATSAVLTAVLGFAFQDTLGNVIGGLALQTDHSIQVGEWIKFNDVTGKVAEIRWRYTAIMTRNGETVLIPNGVLMKNPVMVLARGLQPGKWRRIVTFRVDFRHQPSDVIEVVEAAMRGAPIPGGCTDPAPSCVLMDIGESQCLYAARFWITDPQSDDPPDSVVRTRIFFALARAKIHLSMPAHAVFLTQESDQREETKNKEQLSKQLEALRKVDVLRSLTDDDLEVLAKQLRYAPFTAGEVLTRQGQQAHWLYLIIDGTVSVRVRTADGVAEREVNQLGPGNFFGEMSLLTGAPRSATVVALSDVECYRLGAEPFRQILQGHPEQAADFAEVLAQRQAVLDTARENLDAETRARRHDASKHDLLDRIRDFLGLED